MRVTLLGTGGPRPDPDRQGPATLVEADGFRLLFDAGRGVATQLARADLTVEELDAVFITHHHFDHIGGLGDLLMAAWNWGRRRPLPVYGPPGTADVVAALFENLYAADIRYRIREGEISGPLIEHPSSLVEATDLDSGTVELGPVRIVVGRVEHGEAALGLTDDEWVAVGYRTETGDRSVTISGDTAGGRDLARLARDTDALVICCYLAGQEIDSDQTRFLSEHVLAGAPQVAEIAVTSRCRHLVLTHIRQKSPALIKAMVEDIGSRFSGRITVGQDLLALEV